MVRRFSRFMRLACILMGIVLIGISTALLILGRAYAEMMWMAFFNGILGLGLLVAGIRGTPWSHRLPGLRRS